MSMQGSSQTRAEQMARIKAEQEARKQRVYGDQNTAPAATSQASPLTRTEERIFGITNEQLDTQPTVQPDAPRMPGGVAGANWVLQPDGTYQLQSQGTPVPTSRTTATAPVGATTPVGPTTPPQTTFVASDGTVFVDLESKNRYEQTLANNERAGQSAFALLESEFARYGMQSLVEPLRKFIKQGLSRDELVVELRKVPEYQQRFAANQERINKGLRALSEAEYIGLEDQYQDIMRRYGLPESYYKKEALGRQPGFEQLIGFDVSPTELEERVMIGQNRLNNAPPEVMRLLSDYYSDVISKGDALAYLLDPKNALDQIRRKVTAAEIGAGAAQSGLRTERERAEELQRFGVTGEAARQGYQTIAGGLTRGSQLAAIYQEEPYGQETAETEVFGLAGAAQAGRQRRRLTQQEQAAFGGQTGITGGALSRERAGQY
jgi:hypothetical protein